MLQWTTLESQEHLEDILRLSHHSPQVIFKHSTRCSLSQMARNRLERHKADHPLPSFHFLDLLKYRAVSNRIAEHFSVEHQSPQILVISKEQCIYHASHNQIQMEVLLQNARMN